MADQMMECVHLTILKKPRYKGALLREEAMDQIIQGAECVWLLCCYFFFKGSSQVSFFWLNNFFQH